MAEDHYIVRDLEKTGLAAAFGSEESAQFDAFDCPNCGCHVIAQQRKPLYLFEEIVEDVEEQEDNEEDEEMAEEEPEKDNEEESANNTDVSVVIKSGDHVFVDTTVKTDKTGNIYRLVIDLNELLHAHNWSGVLYGDDSYIAFQ